MIAVVWMYVTSKVWAVCIECGIVSFLAYIHDDAVFSYSSSLRTPVILFGSCRGANAVDLPPVTTDPRKDVGCATSHAGQVLERPTSCRI